MSLDGGAAELLLLRVGSGGGAGRDRAEYAIDAEAGYEMHDVDAGGRGGGGGGAGGGGDDGMDDTW